jgi:hypothetical protein
MFETNVLSIGLMTKALLSRTKVLLTSMLV